MITAEIDCCSHFSNEQVFLTLIIYNNGKEKVRAEDHENDKRTGRREEVYAIWRTRSCIFRSCIFPYRRPSSVTELLCCPGVSRGSKHQWMAACLFMPVGCLCMHKSTTRVKDARLDARTYLSAPIKISHR